MDEAGVDIGISIGAVSRATGIPANTLRTWERRYDFPEPRRSDGGQRLYDPGTVEHLRLVSRALSQGHRPGQILNLDTDTLRELLGVTSTGHAAGPAASIQDSWLDIVRHLDGETLDAAFQTSWTRLGAMRFLVERAVPFLREVGDAWMRGELAVYHEHFATEHLRSFLAGKWRPLTDRNMGPRAVLATMPGERHDVGLHMAAVALALAGWRPVFLGSDTPLGDIGSAAATADAAAVVIGLSACVQRADAIEELEQLRDTLSPGTLLVVGGAGAPRDLAGIDCVDSLPSFEAWARERV